MFVSLNLIFLRKKNHGHFKVEIYLEIAENIMGIQYVVYLVLFSGKN